jgi:chromosome segregation ATPase
VVFTLVDMQVKNRTENELKNLVQQQKEASDKKQAWKQRERELKQKLLELRDQRETALTRKKEIMQALQKYDARKLKLAGKRKDLEEALAKPEEDQAELAEAEEKLKRNILKRIDLAKAYNHMLHQNYMPKVLKLNLLELELTQAKAEVEYFKRIYHERTQALQDAQDEFQSADAQYKENKKKAKNAFQVAKRAGDELREQVSQDESAEYAEVCLLCIP